MPTWKLVKFAGIPYAVDIIFDSTEVENIYDKKSLGAIIASTWGQFLGPFAPPAFAVINEISFRSLRGANEKGGKKGAVLRFGVLVRSLFYNPLKPHWVRIMSLPQAYPEDFK
jgi:hypothetical protein